ncbi:MAG: hypothetical protein P8Z40_16930 [Chloroflexota bacterium]
MGGGLGGDHLLHQLLEEVVRQVVGEVEIRQVVADALGALQPDIRRLLLQRIGYPFQLLGADRLVGDLLLEDRRADHAAPEHLVAHAVPDPLGKDRVLADLQVEAKHLRHGLRVKDHLGVSNRHH